MSIIHNSPHNPSTCPLCKSATNPTNIPETIDEILIVFANKAIDQRADLEMVGRSSKTGVEILEDAKAALSAMVAEIIGEYVPMPRYIDVVTQSIQERYYIGVNKSKADARQRAIAKGFDMKGGE